MHYKWEWLHSAIQFELPRLIPYCRQPEVETNGWSVSERHSGLMPKAGGAVYLLGSD